MKPEKQINDHVMRIWNKISDFETTTSSRPDFDTSQLLWNQLGCGSYMWSFIKTAVKTMIIEES